MSNTANTPNSTTAAAKPANTSATLAMAFVPRQKWRNIYKHETAFPRGTIFAELDKPWLVKGGRGR